MVKNGCTEKDVIRTFKQRVRKYKVQLEWKSKITEMKNTLEGINSRINEAEKWIISWKTEWWKSLLRKKEKEKRNEDDLRGFWVNFKCTNIMGVPEVEDQEKLITGVPKREEREKLSEKTFEEILVENFHNK